MAYKVLVVDDEPAIVELVEYTLQKEGYQVYTAHDGREAWAQFDTAEPDLVLLDLMLPDVDGLELCKRMRHAAATPIIILSAKDAEVDKVTGLEQGADDYIAKPFSPRELVARAKAALRRANLLGGPEGSARRQAITMGELRLDFERHEVLLDGERLDLRPKEFELLGFLMQNPDRVLARDQILQEVWGYEVGVTRTVDVHIRRLRQKLEGDVDGSDVPERDDIPRIETVHGIGYRLLPPEVAQ